MYFFLMAEPGEHEATMLLHGGVLETGTVPDTRERHVLLEQLKVPGSVENSSVSSKR